MELVAELVPLNSRGGSVSICGLLRPCRVRKVFGSAVCLLHSLCSFAVRCDPDGLGGARRLGGGGDEEKRRLVASLPSYQPSRWPRSSEAEAIEMLTLRVGG